MKKLGKQIVSILCVISLLMGTWAVPVWAEEVEQTESLNVSTDCSESIIDDVERIDEDFFDNQEILTETLEQKDEASKEFSDSKTEISENDDVVMEETVGLEDSEDNEEKLNKYKEASALNAEDSEADEDEGNISLDEPNIGEVQSGLEQFSDITEPISSFNLIEDSYIKLDKHISYSELREMLPLTIQGVSANGNVIEVPVTWASDIDYDNSNESYYLFWAVFDNQEYQISTDFNYEAYYPFIEVEIDSNASTTEEESSKASSGDGIKIETSPYEAELVGSSSGVSNIVKRAYQQVQIKWTPLKNVNGYLNSKGELTAIYYAGTTYSGIPYGQQVDKGVYVPNSASFDTFLNAVNNANSSFYLDRGKYAAKGLESTYYASDCSAFVSYSYGLPRMTTATIANSNKFTKVSGNSVYNAEIGDCINKSGVHVVLITDLIYNSSGTLTSVEISEQTPPKAITHAYTPATVSSKYLNAGYTLLRYNGRENVGEPDSYSGYGAGGAPEPPTNPTNFRSNASSYASALDTSTPNVTLSWGASDYADAYVLDGYVTGTDGTVYQFISQQDLGLALSMSLALRDTGTYDMYLWAKNRYGISEKQHCSFRVSNTVPTDPTNFRSNASSYAGAPDTSTANVTLSWGASDYADAYVLDGYVTRTDGTVYQFISQQDLGTALSKSLALRDAGIYDMYLWAKNRIGISEKKHCSFKVVNSLNIADCILSLSVTTYTYDGTAKQPTVTVKSNGITLTAGTDYSVNYSNNINAGTATVKVTGTGNFKGSGSLTFIIDQLSITSATVAGISNKTYTGSAQAQNPTVKLDDKTLVNGTDYSLSYTNNTNAGTATVTITGKGNYTGTVSKNFTINAASIAGATADGISNKTYNGSAQTQNPTVKAGGRTLTNSTDYTLSYTNNTNAGTATVTITGKGNYTGTVSRNFTISAASIAGATVDGISNKTYIGSAQTQNPAVKLSGKTLVNGTDYTLSYANNTNAGTATVTITGKGNYTGTISKNFTISPASIANAAVTGITNKTYTGSAQTQNPTVKLGDRTLANGTDYALSYANNTNVGTATVTITGKGNYTGTISKNFTIGGISIKSATVTGISNKTYNGSAQTQTPTVKVNDKTLTNGTDYTLSYTNNVNAGTATMTITGKGSYAESVSKTFTISPASIAGATVEGLSNKNYNGSAQTQNPAVKLSGRTLANGTDYTLSYANNTNAGTATVTIAGKGNYTGTISKNFTISAASITGTTVDGISNKTYSGSAQTQNPTLKLSGKTLVNGTDYTLSYANNTNAGTATVTISGKGNYTGTVSKNFTISPSSISGAPVEGITNKTYNGSAQTQNPTVKVGGRTLTNGTDYTLSYANNTNAGTATVTIAGKGNYTGTISKNFTISAASIAGATVDGISNKTYSGSAQAQNPTLKLSGKTLVNGTDYALSYANNTNAGTATVTITGKGNYTGTVSKNFTISPASIAGAAVTGITNKTYTGSAQTQNPTVKLGDRTLVNGTDYTLSYANNTNVGTATVTITGKGNYTGTISKNFTIGGISIKNATVTGITSKTYNGAAQTQNPTVKVNDRTLTNGTDYTLSYTNNVNAGTATMTVTGKGSYAESVSKTFTISPASIAGAAVEGLSNKTYNGSAQTQNPTVKLSGRTLANGTDYTLSYANSTNAGTATVTITGKGNYTGTVSRNFTISQAAPTLKFASASVSKTTLDAPFTNALTKTTDGTVTFKSSDENVAKADSTSGQVMVKGVGTATITATATAGKNYKAGTASYTVSVSDGRTDIAGCTVTLSPSSYTYDGKAKKPSVTVKNGTAALVSGTDYTAAYKNNTNAGTATVTVTGKGSYRGTASKTFKISPRSVADAVITGILDKTYNGSEQTQEPVVQAGGMTLTGGTDYTLSYADNTNAGTATVTITGKGNYTGTASAGFTINKAAPTLKFAKSSITKVEGDAAFTNKLTAVTDGTVTYKSGDSAVASVSKTSGKVTVKGAGKTTITATAGEGANYKAGSAKYTLTVTANGAIKSISLSETSITMVYGHERAVPAVAYSPENVTDEKTVNWSSSNEDLVTVTGGRIRAMDPGKAVITATVPGRDVSAAADVRVLFSDVTDAGAWYFDSVYWALDNSITSGYGRGTFQPAAGLTRAQTVSFLYKLAGSPDVSGLAAQEFTDVKKSDWFYAAVKWAAANKITSGYGSGTFRPDGTCTRAMIVSFLMSYSKLVGTYMPPASHADFPDVPPSAWYKSAVDWAVENGITKGYGSGTFSPDVTCNRAMMVTFLKKAAELPKVY